MEGRPSLGPKLWLFLGQSPQGSYADWVGLAVEGTSLCFSPAPCFLQVSSYLSLGLRYHFLQESSLTPPAPGSVGHLA